MSPAVPALAVVAVLGALLPLGSAKADPFPLPIPPIPLPPILQQDCSTANEPIVPTSVEVEDLSDEIPVVALRRKRSDVPGTPPTTKAGRWVMAFDLDSGIRPGARTGNALFNAHTWPDGSALGNALLRELHEGESIVVSSDEGRFCYEVSQRVEVRANSREAAERYFARGGPHQIAIVVCSGKRLGPGKWTHRTIWYASPVR
ncbi:hypothetical protein GCM10009547_21490 [Sporichthya brevicatena]|uniref:Class F sortase n=1 Tax=Sporichthya brevicatena TaxID=171442 RepID=A0ABN1GT84_9ACTN